MIDCKAMHPTCKANCCHVFPIPKKTWVAWKHLKQREVTEVLEIVDTERAVVPMTKDARCAFLSADLSCAIYEHRPEICRKFGDESHPFLTCIYADKEGNRRTRTQRRQLERSISKDISNRFSQW